MLQKYSVFGFIDPVLSEVHYTEDSNGVPTVYYAICEKSLEDGSLLTDSQEVLGDNVFFLSFENEEQPVRDSNDDASLENPVFEEIMLPDGTHAFFKNEPNTGTSIVH